MFQKSILATLSIFLFWVSPVWSNLPEGEPSSVSRTLEAFYSKDLFFPFKGLNETEEGGIFFSRYSSNSLREDIKGYSYSDKNKKLEMLEKRWARHALDTYYSVRDEEKANKQYNNNPTMSAKLGGLPRRLHSALITWGQWKDLLKSQEVLALPSSCYIVAIDVEENIKNEEEAKCFLNQLLPHLVAKNLIHLEVVWNLIDKGISMEGDHSGDCSFVLSGKTLTEAYIKAHKKGLTYPSNFAKKIEELYRPVHALTIEYEKLQGTFSGLEQAVKEKQAKIRSYISSNDYLGIMCHGIESASPKQQQDYASFQENQREIQTLKKELKKQMDDLFEKKSVFADSEIELGKEFFEKVKEMTFSSHISHQDHETQVCEDDFKPEEIISAANKEENLYCNTLRSKESNPSLKCSIIDQEIRNKSALIQQLESLIKQQENILEQQKKDLENLRNGSCSYLVAADKESEGTFPNDPHPTTPKSKLLSPNDI
jgi:hypothetical protein